MTAQKVERRSKIKRRVRKKVLGTTERPRLSVYRSNKQIYAQVIDDSKGVTLASASSLAFGDKDRVNKAGQSDQVGKAIAEKAKAAGIDTVVFDRNGYLYHGRVKSLAEAAREGGLKF
jgi:large subunit ribosomal protein L18